MSYGREEYYGRNLVLTSIEKMNQRLYVASGQLPFALQSYHLYNPTKPSNPNRCHLSSLGILQRDKIKSFNTSNLLVK